MDASAPIPSEAGGSQPSSTDAGDSATAQQDASPTVDGAVDAGPPAHRFPPNLGMIDARADCGAAGDGVTDDTSALRACVQAHVGTHQTIYFPDGTYLVSAPLDWKNADGDWRSYLTFQGAGAALSVIRLANGATGFGDPTAPLAVVRPGSKTDDPACSNYNQNDGNGGGNCGFENYVFDLTIDVGAGNPGAIALDFQASNYGAVEGVRLTSEDGAGVMGLALTRAVGPALVKGVEIDGFETGIDVTGDLYGLTLEHVALHGTRGAGLTMSDNMVAVRDLSSDQASPAIRTSGLGLAVVLDSTLAAGGDAGPVAVDNAASLLARDLTTVGFATAIQNGTAAIDGGLVGEYVSHAPFVLESPRTTTLDLPIEETPVFHDADFSAWARVRDFGAVADDDNDDAAAIQKAVDSGATTVVLPLGRYRIDTPIVLRGAVHRVLGMMSSVYGAASPAFRVQALDGPAVVLERFQGGVSVEHDSDSAVAIRHGAGFTLQSGTGSGPWFLEDVVLAQLTMGARTMWARQLDVEGPGPDLIDNAGGTLWILGLKTEGTATIVRTTAGGVTEILGALVYTTGNAQGGIGFVNDGSSMSLSYDEVTYGQGWAYATQITETRAGITQTLPQSAVVWRGLGGIVPLYVGSP